MILSVFLCVEVNLVDRLINDCGRIAAKGVNKFERFDISTRKEPYRIEGKEFAERWSGTKTVAAGLRVPAADGDFLILRALRESNGTAIAVSDEEIIEGAYQIGRTTGIFVPPEGSATLAALSKLKSSGWIKESNSVVLFNTGSGCKYMHLYK